MDILLICIIFIVPTVSYIFYKTTYLKYNKMNGRINSPSNVIARHLLVQNGLEYVDVEKIKDSKSDHYSANNKIVYLTNNTYNSLSLSSINIVAFECAHAVQDVKGNIVFKLKSILYPIFRFLTTFSYWVAIFGFVLHWDEILFAGVGVSMVALIFNIMFLYLEFDASKKALKYLIDNNIIAKEEQLVSKKVLKSYCFKNIAELMTNSLRFFRLILVNEDPNEENKEVKNINLEELKHNPQNTEIVLNEVENNKNNVNNE